MSKIVIVTGCSSGIGLATAIEFAKNGDTVFAGLRNLSKKDALEAEALKANVKVNIIQLDILDDNSVRNAINEVKNAHGKIDVLVNNAGYGYFGSVESTSIEEFKEQFDTDFFGAIRMIQAVLPIMNQSGSGHIINISSVAGFIGFPVVSAYVTCKFALEGLTECLRQELYDDNPEKRIHVILIEPGVVNTKFYDNMKYAKNAFEIPRYSGIIKKIQVNGKAVFKEAMNPEKVAKKILSVIEEENPEPRYRVGYDADLYWADKITSTPLQFEEIVREMVKDFSEARLEDN